MTRGLYRHRGHRWHRDLAVGRKIRELDRLQKRYGKGRWRKRKGAAKVRLEDGTIRDAELHWYEATGIGRLELKIKRYLD